MQIFPAIDIKSGRVGRASPDGDIVYARDPVAAAEGFLAAGASWLHVVDLDRALATGGDNDTLVRRICALPGVRVQVGGLLERPEDVTRAQELGAARIVVAAAAAADADVFTHIVADTSPERLAVGLDVRGGALVRRGARAPLGVSPRELLRRAAGWGVRVAIYRDLDKDGALGGADVVGAAALLGSGVEIVVSGGIASAEHLRAAREAGLAGAIVGRALHEGRLTLPEAVACSR